MQVMHLTAHDQGREMVVRLGLDACFAIIKYFSRNSIIFYHSVVYSQKDGRIQQCVSR